MPRLLNPTVPLALVAALAAPISAQTRADFHYEKALAAGSEVSIHNVTGDVKVTPSTNGKVTVLGIKRGSGSALDRIHADVHEGSRGLTICVLYDDSESSCDEDGIHTRSHRNNRDWDDVSMDLEVAVPANVTVSAGSVSGDVTVDGAHGDVSASSVSGDVRLDHLHATAVNAHSVSGDIDVRIDDLTGRGDLSLKSVSGDVTLAVPSNFAADLSMSTVSGDINSDFPITLGGSSRMSRRRLEARIGGGGRRLDVSTVSGDLRIRSVK